MQFTKGVTTAIVAGVLVACGGGGGGGTPAPEPSPGTNNTGSTNETGSNNTGSNNNTGPNTPPVVDPNCTETGVSAAYACKTGSTEPLFTYQWALKLVGSFFSAFSSTSGGLDLNVEWAHQAGIKGQGVRVLVLDDGLEVTHEDLAANVDLAMSHNFITLGNDPSPTGVQDAHGTSAAGIIAAAQNGKGVMGVAPRATLGGANFLGNVSSAQDILDAYGGAPWSSSAYVVNASYGTNPSTPPQFESASAPPEQTAIRAFPGLRAGKGLVYVKATGNEFGGFGSGVTKRDCPAPVLGVVSCENPAHDTETLETNVVAVAAANAQALRASYSSVGSVNWITGLAGEFAYDGIYGQNSGPTLMTTDQIGCAKGFSYTGTIGGYYADNAFLQGATGNNPNCDYGMLNGTSAATPTISGVVALMLQANPNLTWRDVREILRSTARKIQSNFGSGGPSGNRAKLIDLTSTGATTGGTFTSTAVGTSADLLNGATTARVEYGWQTNGAGYDYSNAFGFGLVDAAAAVAQAKATTTYRSAALTIPSFTSAASLASLSYGRVTRVASINLAGATGQVDAFQVRLTGPLCVGSVGVFVKSPSGTVSALSVPYNIYYKSGNASVTDYGLSSYAFFGEPKAGTWEVYFVSGTPIASGTGACSAAPSSGAHLNVEYRILGRV